MSGLVIDLARVRHAVWQSDFMGMPETRRQVVQRQVADAREAQRIGPTLANQHDERVRSHVHAYTAPGARGGAN